MLEEKWGKERGLAEKKNAAVFKHDLQDFAESFLLFFFIESSVALPSGYPRTVALRPVLTDGSPFRIRFAMTYIKLHSIYQEYKKA